MDTHETRQFVELRRSATSDEQKGNSVLGWLLNSIYAVLLFVGSPWIAYRIVFLKKNRRGWCERFLGFVPKRDSHNQCLWFHAVSVGEVQLLGPIIDQLINSSPTVDIVISTTTEAGFDVAQKRFGNFSVFFCPLDFTWSIRTAIRRIRPSAVILVELELWPNLLRFTDREKIPVMVVNGRMSERSFRQYQWIAPIARRMLRQVDVIAAQSQTYAKRFMKMGAAPKQVFISGNIKFDGAFNPSHAVLGKRLQAQFGIDDQDAIFVAGSTQPEEDELVVDVYKELRTRFPSLQLVIVPRHLINVEALVKNLETHALPYVRRSGGGPTAANERPVIVVDVMGELAGWWAIADFAYVGGSMGSRGGQNMIEPAAHRAAVSFGPRTENFRDVVKLLLDNEAAVVVHSRNELQQFLEMGLMNPGCTVEMGARAHTAVASQQGATQRTCLEINRLLGYSSALSSQSRAA